MEKEALIESLREKVGENDFSVLSEKTIDALVTPFLSSFADDGKITDDTWAMPVAMLKNFVGQYRHDLAAGSDAEKQRLAKENETAARALAEKQFAEFKEEWEKTHKTVAGDDDKNKGGNGGKSDDAVTRALEEYNKKLFGEDGKSGLIGGQLNATSEFIANSKKAADAEKISLIRQDLKRYLVDDRKASREPVVNLAIKELDVKKDSDIDKLKVEVEKIYETHYKSFYGDGGKPFGGDTAGGSGKDGGHDEVSEYLKKRGESAAKQAEIMQKVKGLLR